LPLAPRPLEIGATDVSVFVGTDEDAPSSPVARRRSTGIVRMSSAPDKARRMEQWRASRHLTHAANPFRDAPDDAASILTAAAVVPTTPGDGASHRPRTPPETPATPYELFDVEPPIGLGHMPWDSAGGGQREATTPGDSSTSSGSASPPSTSEDSAEPRDGRLGRSGARRRPPPSPAPTLLFDEPAPCAHPDDRSGGARGTTQLDASSAHHRHHPSGRVRVSVRIRPPTPTELVSAQNRGAYRPAVEPAPEQSRVLVRGRIPITGHGCATENAAVHKEMRFDAVFAETASQKRVYEEAASAVVEGVLRGYNGTVLAYGQTGTGKTYTMSGPLHPEASESSRLENQNQNQNPFVPTQKAFGGCAGEDRGVVARALERILRVCAADGAHNSQVSGDPHFFCALFRLILPKGSRVKITNVSDVPDDTIVLSPFAGYVAVRAGVPRRRVRPSRHVRPRRRQAPGGARGPVHRRGVRGWGENRGGDEFSERDANAAGRRTVRLSFVILVAIYGRLD